MGKHSYLHHRYLVGLVFIPPHRTPICHVCLLTIKYVSTVQYLSISILYMYIHNLRLSDFAQLKGCSRATPSCDSSYLVVMLQTMRHEVLLHDAMKMMLECQIISLC